jgi:NAD(P)-dependent dehydrogenase (short-subunit alcohol dehydrogenase family)
VDLELAGKRAVVTGAGRGIGLAVARGLAAEGARLALVGRGEPALRSAADLIDSAHGTGALAVAADTTDDASVRSMIEQVVAQLGGVDILVNCAARPASAGPAAGLAELTDDAMRLEYETKVLGYLRCARAAAPHMIAQGWGRIVNISGLNARRAGSIAGSVRNVAVAALTKNLADELGPAGIGVTVVHPGTTVTERTPTMVAELAARDGGTAEQVLAALGSATCVGRLITAAEVADVVVFLCSPRSVAINGDAVAAGGGMRGSIHY